MDILMHYPFSLINQVLVSHLKIHLKVLLKWFTFQCASKHLPITFL